MMGVISHLTMEQVFCSRPDRTALGGGEGGFKWEIYYGIQP